MAVPWVRFSGGLDEFKQKKVKDLFDVGEEEDVPTSGSAPPPGDGGEGDDAGTDPDHEDEAGRPLVGHLAGVLEGVGDGPVAVHGDDTEVEDGGGGGKDVQGVPQVTPQATTTNTAVEYPVLIYDI